MAASRSSRETGVWHAGTLIANTWLVVDSEGRRTLVDSGHRTERALLLRGLARLGVRRRGELHALILTHRHSDHAGNAAFLQEHFGCELIGHAADRPFLEGERRAERLAGRGAPLVHDALCRVEDAFPARAHVDRVVDDGDTVAGFEVTHVGGHTEGSILLYHRESATLFTGDALLAGAPVQRVHVRLRLAYSVYSNDAELCHANTRAWLRSRPTVARLCAGHGPMVERGLEAHLARIAS